MSQTNDPILDAIAGAARDATGAAQAWILRRNGDQLDVVAAAGQSAGNALAQSVPAGSGSAGYVVESGQPLALSADAGDERTSGVASDLGGDVTSLLCVPCGDEDAIHGALELVNKPGAARFSIDDVEIATLLGAIAGTALSNSGATKSVASPEELSQELARVAQAEPGRYAALAEVVSALLARG